MSLRDGAGTRAPLLVPAPTLDFARARLSDPHKLAHSKNHRTRFAGKRPHSPSMRWPKRQFTRAYLTDTSVSRYRLSCLDRLVGHYKWISEREQFNDSQPQ